MAHHQVLKAMSTERKMLKIWVFGFTWRQFFIVFGVLAPFYIAYGQLAPLLHLDRLATAIFFAPWTCLALFLAFVKKEGRHMDWHLARWWEKKRNPSVMLWRRTQGTPRGRLQDSVQANLPHEHLSSHLARTKDGTRYLVFKAFRQPSVALAGEEERDRLWARSKAALDALDFPLVEILDSREGNFTTYAEDLRAKLAETLTEEQENLLLFARQHLRHISEVAEGHNVFERVGYVVLPYRPLEAGAEGADSSAFAAVGRGLSELWRQLSSRGPTEKAARELQEEDEAALRVLSERGRVLLEAYEEMGVSLRMLYGEELIRCLRGMATGEEEGDADGLDPLSQIVCHDGGGYDELPPHKRERVLGAARAAQDRAPLAPACGFLTLPDAVAPDCVEVHDDYLKVGDEYLSFLFVWAWPSKVRFPQLAPLATMRGRIRVVKYLNPIPQDAAADLFGRQVAALSAAEEAADDGDVLERARRRSEKRDAERGMDELIEEKQRFFELTLLVACRADSLGELKALVGAAKTKLRGIGARPMLARKEMWRAYASCLALGGLRLERYALKGMLSEPLADLQLFVSHQIDHDTGVWLGVDPESGHPVTLDTRRLHNPHVVVIGVPGAGKTQAVKAWTTRLRLRGETVVVIDPRGNSGYKRVARAMDGEYVPFGIGSESRINPFDIAGYLNLELLAALAGDEAEALDAERLEWARRRAREAALDGKVDNLRRLVSIMAQGEGGDGLLTSEEEGEVDALLRQTYEGKGITDDPGTHDREPPTFPDFFAALAARIEGREADGDRERAERLRSIRARLRLWETGSLRTIFSGHTNVDLSNKYVCFHLARLEGRPKAAVYCALQDFLVARLSDPDEPTNCVDDEMWEILRYPLAAKVHMEQFRTGRARNNRMIGATQDVEEFAASEDGRTILSIAETTLVLRLKDKPVKELSKYVEISEDQKDKIRRLPQGQGHLMVGDASVPLRVLCSEEEMRLFNTDPQKERDYKEREAARAIDGAPTVLEANDVGEEVAGNGAHLGRRLSAAGRARRLLAIDEREARPRPEDYEDPPPETTGDEETPERGAPLFPRCEDGGEAPLWAVVGEGSGLVAYNLAGLLAHLSEGRDVLLVDAEGSVSVGPLAHSGADAPGEGSAEDGRIHRHCLARDEASGLWALPFPEDEHLPAHALVRAVRGSFDLVIVACGDSFYAAEWLREATRVVAAGSEGLAECVDRAERLRGEDGSLVVAMGDAEIPAALSRRRLYRMPAVTDEVFLEAERGGAFASLEDPRLKEATEELARELSHATGEEGGAR